MTIQHITPDFSISSQIIPRDIDEIKRKGFKTIICNRPDEENGAVNHEKIEKNAKKNNIDFYYIPVISGNITTENVNQMAKILKNAKKPVLAYCKTGNRSKTLFQLIQNTQNKIKKNHQNTHIVIVGAGAAGISTAASIITRNPNANITIIDPAETHCYQPGWTMVGAGIFSVKSTIRKMKDQIPKKMKWIKNAVETFQPENNTLTLNNGKKIQYDQLIVCPGIKLNWDNIKGLKETLGKNGVTSNYSPNTAPYTWELVQKIKNGTAIFTQPPMPIKCAGAPQKALYLSAHHWMQNGILKNINVEFCNAGSVLFSVPDYVEPLMEYIKKYNVNLQLNTNLTEIDGPNKTATFSITDTDGTITHIKKNFDMIHVCPPQSAPDFIKNSPLANETGWVDVNHETLKHNQYDNIWAVGDAISAPNAKTAAAIRKQAPIVAENLLAHLKGKNLPAQYSGYGSCPLTVEKGKIILAEFGYGGKLQPTFPKWFINGLNPTKTAWLLKAKILPHVYWNGMLKGKEWLVKPKHSS